MSKSEDLKATLSRVAFLESELRTKNAEIIGLKVLILDIHKNLQNCSHSRLSCWLEPKNNQLLEELLNE